jgi:hypothetical protein
MRLASIRWTSLAALLGVAACAAHPGEEPLYVLRDQLGRAVAMAGSAQLGGAAPGTTLRVNLAGVEQEVMVGERLGFGPAMAPRPAAAAPVEAAPAPPPTPLAAIPPVAATPLMSAVTSTPLDPPALESATNRRGGETATAPRRRASRPADAASPAM